MNVRSFDPRIIMKVSNLGGVKVYDIYRAASTIS